MTLSKDAAKWWEELSNAGLGEMWNPLWDSRYMDDSEILLAIDEKRQRILSYPQGEATFMELVFANFVAGWCE